MTACQQLLALGVVVVALAPATRVVSLDVVGVPPGATSGRPAIAAPGVELSACERKAARLARKAATRGEPVVRARAHPATGRDACTEKPAKGVAAVSRPGGR